MIVNPIGIDYPIQEIQQIFIDSLWTDIDVSRKQFNHRVFKNKDRNGNVVPEIYTKDNEYREIRFNDRLDVLSWFDVADSTESYNAGWVNQQVGIFFAVNLDKLYPTLTHRAVEESHRDVLNLLSKQEIQGVITNEPAYGDYYTENLKRFNMQPWHVFRIEYLIKYGINC